MPPPTLSLTFTTKKSQILADIGTHDSAEYADKSPKGTIDVEIIDLINEINAFDEYVTTSSCAGRVAVFVEGKKANIEDSALNVSQSSATGFSEGGSTGQAAANLAGITAQASSYSRPTNKPSAAGPGGKGFGNKWLYVSHSPIPSQFLSSSNTAELHQLFQLPPAFSASSLEQTPTFSSDTIDSNPRLVKLSFSPLILHIFCATLQAAKPLLAAAINAGFRESGVQSLRALDDKDAGVMLAVRTAGLTFETMVGIVEQDYQKKDNEGDAMQEDGEVYRSLVSEDYLRLCTAVINQRFRWNVERRERLRRELGRIREELQKGKEKSWEDKEERRRRKREEGLRLRLRQPRIQSEREHAGNDTEDKENQDFLSGATFLQTV